MLFICVRPSNILRFSLTAGQTGRLPLASQLACGIVRFLFSGRPAMPDFSSLTDRQREIYEFIRGKIEGRGYGPTVREIGQAFDIRSPNGVMCHLKALEKKGLIIREGFSARAIQLTDHRPPSLGLPLLGSVAAGPLTEAIQNDDRLELDELFGGPDNFAMKVRGQSMIE